MNGESATFSLTPALQENEAGPEKNVEPKSVLIILAHGYGDAGVTKAGVDLAINDRIATEGNDQQIPKLVEGHLRNRASRLRPGSILQNAKRALQRRREEGKSGLLTNYAASMIIELANSEQGYTSPDIVSPTLTRDEKYLPKDATIFTGGTEARGYELLGSILDWLIDNKDEESGQFKAVDEVIVAGHSLGGPTVSSLFNILGNGNWADPRIGEDRKDAFIAAQSMLLGHNDQPPHSTTSVHLIDPGIDPHHRLIMPQKMTTKDGALIAKKQTIIAPLVRAISKGTLEQIDEVMSAKLPVREKLLRVAFKLPQLTRIIKYSANIPAVLHEAGDVISAKSLHDFVGMTHLIEQSNTARMNKAKPSTVTVSFHENDQIFPANTMTAQLEDRDGVYALQPHLPEERLAHQSRHGLNYLSRLIKETNNPESTHRQSARFLEKVSRIYRIQSNISGILLRTAAEICFGKRIEPLNNSRVQSASYNVGTIPGGSHTSVGTVKGSEMAAKQQRDLTEPSA